MHANIVSAPREVGEIYVRVDMKKKGLIQPPVIARVTKESVCIKYNIRAKKKG